MEFLQTADCQVKGEVSDRAPGLKLWFRSLLPGLMETNYKATDIHSREHTSVNREQLSLHNSFGAQGMLSFSDNPCLLRTGRGSYLRAQGQSLESEDLALSSGSAT